jgi:hypothetical protein
VTRYAIPPDVACATVDDGAVVLHMGTKRYFSLNETGAAIWRLLEDGIPLDDIATRVTEQYDVAIDAARAAVDELITALEASSLLTLDRE